MLRTLCSRKWLRMPFKADCEWLLRCGGWRPNSNDVGGSYERGSGNRTACGCWGSEVLGAGVSGEISGGAVG